MAAHDGSPGRDDAAVQLPSACPRLHLHPAHLGGQRGFTAIPSNDLPEEFVSLSASDLSVVVPLRPEPADLGGLPCVGLSDGKLLAAWPDARTALLEVRLLFMHAALGYSPQWALPAIALSSKELGSSWLILVDGDAASAQEVLASAGQWGAIRPDFSDLYSLESKALGKGANAAVYGVIGKGEANVGAGRLAGKVSLRDSLSAKGDRVPKDVCQEVSMLSAAQRHPNIIGFYGLFRCESTPINGREGPQWVLLMERCDGGDLVDAVFKSLFSESRARSTMTGLLSALAYAHSRQVVHRDVKPDNILLSADGERAVLADFGIACQLSDLREMDRRCGSPAYAAPEIIKGKPYGAKVDSFSSGSLLFFILCAKVPFYGSTITSMIRRTLRCVVDFGISPEFRQISIECKDFILSLLQKCPVQRLSAQDALSHRWITQEAPMDAASASGANPLAAATLALPSPEEAESPEESPRPSASPSMVTEPQAPPTAKTCVAPRRSFLPVGGESSKAITFSQSFGSASSSSSWMGQRTDRHRHTDDSREVADEPLTPRGDSPHRGQGGASASDDEADAEGRRPSVRGYIARGMSRLFRGKSRQSDSYYSSESSEAVSSDLSESAPGVGTRQRSDTRKSTISSCISWCSTATATSSKAPWKRSAVEKSPSSSSSGLLSPPGARLSSDLTPSPSSVLDTVYEEHARAGGGKPKPEPQYMSFSEVLMSDEEYGDVEVDAVGLEDEPEEGSFATSVGQTPAVAAASSSTVPRPPHAPPGAAGARRPVVGVRYVPVPSGGEAAQPR